MTKKKQIKKPRSIAVCTTFPASQFDVCAAEMLASFKKHWSEDIKIYIQLDESPASDFDTLNNKIIDIVGDDRAFIAGQFDKDQKEFMERWKDHKPKSYLDDVVKWSHKVFSLEKCADAIKDDIDILIWLDADVISKEKIDREWLEQSLPGSKEICSYLGRDTIYPECGFVAYNLKAGGYDLLKSMRDVYIQDRFVDYKKGVTDCHIFIAELKKRPEESKNLSPDFKYERDDLHVWLQTKLADRFEHRKGQRKVTDSGKPQPKQKQPNGNQIVDSDNLNIKTRNCLDHEKICGNIRENKSQIRNWATLCKPTPTKIYADVFEDIIICAAGPSLADHIEQIKEMQSNGAKVIAVKHAIDTLKTHNIKPWAVVLLDPRGHVEDFVKTPDPDPYYFVASMCDPNVVKTLNQHGCKVIGYHALVNAGETAEFLPGELPVGGGSATTTRSIGLFADMFGFKSFHIFGCDLCHYQKPDMNEKLTDGQLKYMELSLGTYTHNNKYITRTFWTEGQFLAQSNELKALYKDRKDIQIAVHGNGIAGWLHKHYNLHQKYILDYKTKLDRKRNGTPYIDEYLAAITVGSELARNV